MRLISAFILSTALALPFAAPALAEATITVTGEASIATTPDMATVSLGVTTEGATAAEAMAAKAVQLLIERLGDGSDIPSEVLIRSELVLRETTGAP